MSARYVGKTARMLWAGFEDTALPTLKDLTDARHGVDTRVAAWRELAKWHATCGRPDAAADAIDEALRADPAGPPSDETRAIAIDLLCEAGRTAEALALLDDAPDRFRHTTAAALRRFNILVTERPDDPELAATALGVLNEPFLSRGFGAIALVDDDEGLRLSNLRGVVTRDVRPGRDLVSVIMPASNAASTIGFAIRGLLEQTWSSLEVLVVDDGSTDDTLDVVASFDDPRVRTLHNPGRGTYAARNHGLANARGAFITVNDADDWPHPEKIERQVRPLRADDSLIATISSYVRTRHSLYFPEPSLRPRSAKVITNMSSFLIRRIAFDVLGPWDTPRVAADNELIERCAAFYGHAATRHVAKDLPLMFALRADTSLTSSLVGIGILSNDHVLGARRQYKAAYQRWHGGDFLQHLPLDPSSPHAPMLRPRLLGNEGRDDVDVDVIYYADLARGDDDPIIAEIEAHRAAGRRCGLLHVPDYERELHRYRQPQAIERFPDALTSMLDGDDLRLVSAGETLRTPLLVIRPHQLLHHPILGLPSIDADRVVVVVESIESEHEPELDVDRCLRTLAAAGWHRSTWYAVDAGVQGEIRALLQGREGVVVSADLWPDGVPNAEMSSAR
jgi:glycosyltransferase involved in cell wall biosynthesis